jgi:hypothetical protein
MRARENRAKYLQQFHLGADFFLLFFAESFPPVLELVCVLNLSAHRRAIIPSKEYSVNGM